MIRRRVLGLGCRVEFKCCESGLAFAFSRMFALKAKGADPKVHPKS